MILKEKPILRFSWSYANRTGKFSPRVTLQDQAPPSPGCHCPQPHPERALLIRPMLASNSTAHIPVSDTCDIKVLPKFKRQISSPLLSFHPTKSRDGEKNTTAPVIWREGSFSTRMSGIANCRSFVWSSPGMVPISINQLPESCSRVHSGIAINTGN